MTPLYTLELSEALTTLLDGLEFLVDRGADTRPISDEVLTLITKICELDRQRFGGEK